jgi:type IV pilus assembly protein PilB
MTSRAALGDLVVQQGVVDRAGLARAQEAPTTRSVSLGRTLSNLGLADEDSVGRAIAAGLGLEFHSQEPSPAGEGPSLISPDFCRRRGVHVLDADGTQLRLAMHDPLDRALIADVELCTGRQVVPVVVTERWLERAQERRRAVREQGGAPVTPAGRDEASGGNRTYELQDPMSANPSLPQAVRLVNAILADAMTAGASDVHIEPQDGNVQVRQRVDGLLRAVLTLPESQKDQTVSRLKIISGMDIAERRKPQDGRARVRFEGRELDLRVSTLPTQFGEKVVIRLLTPQPARLDLDQLDFTAENLRVVRQWLSRPQGMILVTGPTGSGKTSTLYAALGSITSTAANIVTLEDPIEFQVPGVSQTQINPRAGVTFASGLRSILRQDPNIILVGEIRDLETADVAFQAAQTGHLLLSTVHTIDAATTVTRLFDLDVPPFMVASSLMGVLAQRLVRRPCAACAMPQAPSVDVIERIGGPSRLPAGGDWRVGLGCEACGFTGFKGRLAIHELLQVTEDVRALIATRAAESAIRQAARRVGFRTMLDDGIGKAAQGQTTLEEVLRVVPADELAEAATTAAARPAPVDPVPPAGPATAPSAPAAAPARGSRPRVLLVEDSPTIVSVVKYFLELDGFDVVVAEDGIRGLAAARRELPDLIVSDVNMPGMDGFALVQALRADPATGEIRVVMLTSEDSIERETQGLDAGADDYLAKPVEPRRLAARIKAVLGRRRAAGAVAPTPATR